MTETYAEQYHRERVRQSQEECREILGDERFRLLVEEVDQLPPKIDRGYVYQAITVGEMTRCGDQMIPTKAWCRRRDEALEDLGAAVTRLRVVFRDHPANERLDIESWVDDLDREYRKLNEPERPDEITFAENTRANILTRDRQSMGWASEAGGRPAHVWKHQTIAMLRKQGVTLAAAEGLVEAAGLL